MIKIKIMMENSCSHNLSLKAEHGLSYYIEAEGRRFIFDCGSGNGTAWDNADKMNVDVCSADGVVLSHSHYDHAGGYPRLLEKGLRAPLYTGPGFWKEKYAFDGIKHTYLGCGFGKVLLSEMGIEHHVCNGMLELSPGITLAGGFERFYPFETPPKRFVREAFDGMETDDFSDEICMVLESAKGLVVVVGCSHPGILNMLETIFRRFGKEVYAVFGGSHLVEADEGRIEKTAGILNGMGVRVLGLNHCTGEAAERYLKEHMQDLSVCHLGTGDCFLL